MEMEQIYIILFVVIVFMLLMTQKKEGMCVCRRGLDYYGSRKCMDWEETVRRNKLTNFY